LAHAVHPGGIVAQRESISIGQWAMGADNARRVKARLWEIRRELLAASAPR